MVSPPISELRALPRLTCCVISIAAFLYPAPLCLSLAAETRMLASERFSEHFIDILIQFFIHQNTARYFS